MGIDYKNLRNLTARQIIAALIRDGFSLDRQVGSHQHYLHVDGRRAAILCLNGFSISNPKRWRFGTSGDFNQEAKS